jgi:CheY-like chemotaxis protein
MAKLSKEKYLVLMVDDSEDDCLLIKMAVGKAERLSFIGSVADGDELVAYFQGEGEFADRVKFPLPDLLLLDLMMPRKNGFEVLEWMQSQPFDDMIVVVLTGSDQAEDLKRAMELGADHYHPKTGDSKGRLQLVKLLEEYVSKGRNKTKS